MPPRHAAVTLALAAIWVAYIAALYTPWLAFGPTMRLAGVLLPTLTIPWLTYLAAGRWVMTGIQIGRAVEAERNQRQRETPGFPPRA